MRTGERWRSEVMGVCVVVTESWSSELLLVLIMHVEMRVVVVVCVTSVGDGDGSL